MTMRRPFFRFIVALSIFAVCFAAVVVGVINKHRPQMTAYSQAVSKQEADKTLSVSQNPCELYVPWTKDGYNQYKLSMNGYPTEVSLAQAVEDFNKMAQCHLIGKMQPLLTVEELLAAIRGSNRSEERIEPWVFEIYQKISKTEMMPKGSFLDYGLGANNLNGYDIRAWSINLFVGLDKYSREIMGNPFYIRLVRKQYISSQPTKSTSSK